MSLGEGVWRHIRAGRTPDHDAVVDLVEPELARLGSAGAASTRAAVESRVLGAGPLEPLLAEPDVTDVAVNGDGGVWADRGHGMQPVPIDVGGPDALRRLAVRLAGLAGRRLDESAPFVDGHLPSGVRLHAVLPPLVPDGPHVTLRIPARQRPTLADLQRAGTLLPGWGEVLEALVARRVAFVVTGGTGAGKTTLLGSLLSRCPAGERIVLVEDVRELAIDHPHVVRLEARPANVEGVGEVTLTTLVRQALRMRPDRLVVGEVRGPEVRELLAALNTGHEGGCGTLHANTPADVVARFEALGALADLSPAAIHAQLASAVDVVLHLCRTGVPAESAAAPGLGAPRAVAAGSLAPGRRLESIDVLMPGPGGRPGIENALLVADGRTVPGPGWPRLAALTEAGEPC